MHLHHADDRQHLWDWLYCSSPRCVCFTRFRCPFNRLCCCVSQCQSLLDFLGPWTYWFAWFFSAASYEVFIKTALLMWNLREQNVDNSRWQEEYDKAVLRAASFFAMAFDPIFRWLKESIFQGTPTTWNFCSLLSALTLTISLLLHSLFESWCLRWHQHSVLSIALLASTLIFVSTVGFRMAPKNVNLCGRFREMQIVRHAKYVGTIIGPHGRFHRWTAARKKFVHRVMKSTLSPKVWFNDNAISRSTRPRYWVSLAPSVLPTMPLSKPKTMPFSVPQLPYNAIPSSLLKSAPSVDLALMWLAFTRSV